VLLSKVSVIAFTLLSFIDVAVRLAPSYYFYKFVRKNRLLWKQQHNYDIQSLTARMKDCVLVNTSTGLLTPLSFIDVAVRLPRDLGVVGR
jgi:hypothetical protein